MRMLIITAAVIGALTMMSFGAALAWVGLCEIGRARQKRREQAGAEAWQPGDHEFCDLTDEEQGWFDYFKNRYRSLGEGVSK